MGAKKKLSVCEEGRMGYRKIAGVVQFLNAIKTELGPYVRFLYTRAPTKDRWAFASLYVCMADILVDRHLYAETQTAVLTKELPLVDRDVDEQIDDLNAFLQAAYTSMRVLRMFGVPHIGCPEEEREDCPVLSCEHGFLKLVEFEESDDFYRRLSLGDHVTPASSPLSVVVRPRGLTLSRLQVSPYDAFRSGFDRVHLFSEGQETQIDHALADPNLQEQAEQLVRSFGSEQALLAVLSRWRLRRRHFYAEAPTFFQQSFEDMAYDATVDRCLLYNQETLDPPHVSSDDSVYTSILLDFTILDVARLVASFSERSWVRPSFRCTILLRTRIRCPFPKFLQGKSTARCAKHQITTLPSVFSHP